MSKPLRERKMLMIWQLHTIYLCILGSHSLKYEYMKYEYMRDNLEFLFIVGLSFIVLFIENSNDERK